MIEGSQVENKIEDSNTSLCEKKSWCPATFSLVEGFVHFKWRTEDLQNSGNGKVLSSCNKCAEVCNQESTCGGFVCTNADKRCYFIDHEYVHNPPVDANPIGHFFYRREQWSCADFTSSELLQEIVCPATEGKQFSYPGKTDICSTTLMTDCKDECCSQRSATKTACNTLYQTVYERQGLCKLFDGEPPNVVSRVWNPAKGDEECDPSAPYSEPDGCVNVCCMGCDPSFQHHLNETPCDAALLSDLGLSVPTPRPTPYPTYAEQAPFWECPTYTTKDECIRRRCYWVTDSCFGNTGQVGDHCSPEKDFEGMDWFCMTFLSYCIEPIMDLYCTRTCCEFLYDGIIQG